MIYFIILLLFTKTQNSMYLKMYFLGLKEYTLNNIKMFMNMKFESLYYQCYFRFTKGL